MTTTPLAALWRFEPRVMTDRAFWEGVRRSTRHRPLVEQVLRVAEETPSRPTVPAASDYLAARRHNDRARVDRVWHMWRRELSALATRRALLGLDPQDPDDRLLDWLWAFVTHPTWVLSAHLPGNDLPASGAPQLDLAACEFAAMLAEIREVLGPWIDSVSGTLGETIVAEIDRRVLGPFGDGAKVFWAPEDESWHNNWTGVCAGSILAACESLAVQGRPRPDARARALRTLRLFFDGGFTPHGECDEGMGYWSYGVGVATIGLSRLSREELEREFDLERIARVADYPRRVHLFDDVFLSGNDASPRELPDLGFVPWLGVLCGNGWLLRWAATRAIREPRHFPMILRQIATPEDAWTDAATADEPSPAVLLEDQQSAILRLPTPAGEMVATLTGGTNDERHNHNDLGHFTVALDRRTIVPDLGVLWYAADFFGPRRYTYRAAASWGHNCPVVAGHDQRPGAEAAGRVLDWRPEEGVLSVELAAAYPPEAGLRRWVRTLRREEDGFTLTDEYATDRPGVEIDHVLWTLSEPTWCGEGVMEVEGLRVTVTPQPAERSVEAHDPVALRLRDFNDRQLHRTTWRYRTDAAGRLRVETRLMPT